MMTMHHTPLLLALLAAISVAHAQDTTTPTKATPLTPVHVHADTQRGYRADTAQMDTFGSFGNAPLHSPPRSCSRSPPPSRPAR